MNNSKSMTTGYRAVFVFSVLMMLGTFFIGAATQSKGSLGTLLWGYTAWLMYKRRNESLVTLFRILLFFEGVVAIISVFAFSRRDGATANLINLSVDEFLISYAIAAALTYLLLRFFARALANQQVSSDSVILTSQTSDIADDFWVKASREFATPERHEALWAQVFSDADGDESKAKARYIKVRALRLQESSANDKNIQDEGKQRSSTSVVNSRLKNNIASISIGLVAIGLVGVYVVSQSKPNGLYPMNPPRVAPHAPISDVEIMKKFRGMDDWSEKAKFIQSLLQSGQLTLKTATPVTFENRSLNTDKALNIEHNQQWWLESNGVTIMFFYNLGYGALEGIRLSIDSSNCKPENAAKSVFLDYRLDPSLAQYDMGAYLLENLVQHPDVVSVVGRPNCIRIVGVW